MIAGRAFERAAAFDRRTPMPWWPFILFVLLLFVAAGGGPFWLVVFFLTTLVFIVFALVCWLIGEWFERRADRDWDKQVEAHGIEEAHRAALVDLKPKPPTRANLAIAVVGLLVLSALAIDAVWRFIAAMIAAQ